MANDELIAPTCRVCGKELIGKNGFPPTSWCSDKCERVSAKERAATMSTGALTLGLTERIKWYRGNGCFTAEAELQEFLDRSAQALAAYALRISVNRLVSIRSCVPV
jgi:hypothetical protein